MASFLKKIMGIFGSKLSKSDVASPTGSMVKSLINSDTVVIFAKTDCSYCKMAREVFDQIPHKYTLVNIDTRKDSDAVQQILGEITGEKTVPRVFVKGKCLGGGTDVQELFESGKLLRMLKTKPAIKPERKPEASGESKTKNED